MNFKFNKIQFFLIILIIFLIGCSKEKEEQKLELKINKVLLDIEDNPEGFPPPILILEMELQNQTGKSIDFRFSDQYREGMNSKLMIVDLVSNEMVIPTGVGTFSVDNNAIFRFKTNIYLGLGSGSFFNISEDYLDSLMDEYHQYHFNQADIDYLFSRIKDKFTQSILLLYLNSKDANHLNPVNQANEYFANDNVILVKWADNLKYEIYEAEEPPSPQDLPQY